MLKKKKTIWLWYYYKEEDIYNQEGCKKVVHFGPGLILFDILLIKLPLSDKYY